MGEQRVVRVLILGAGGHAQVVADIVLRMRETDSEIIPLGYLDDNEALGGQRFLALPVLGTVDALATIPHDAVVIAIGDNRRRQLLFQRLRSQGERFFVARHPSATIAPDAILGPGTMVCAGAIVNPGSVIGANVILNTACTVDHQCSVGDHAHIAPGVHLGGEVTVGEGAFLGIGTNVVPRCNIGKWSEIGIGSVVTKDIPCEVMAIGVPARIIRRAEQAAAEAPKVGK